MFGHPPSWGDSSIPDIHSLFTPRSSRRHLHSRFPSLPEPLGSTHRTRCSHHEHHHHKHHKHPRSDSPSTPSSSDLSSPDWEDTDPYILDTDSSQHDDYRTPRFPSPRSQPYSRRASPNLPGLRCTHVTLPTATAEALQRDEILILPTLTHICIRVQTPYCRGEEHVRAAVGNEMKLRDAIMQIVSLYYGEGVKESEVRMEVRQRRRWVEPSSSSTVEELACRSEVFRQGRKEIEVRIVVGDDGERERERERERESVKERFGGRGLRGAGFGADGATVWEREESRFRVGI